MNRLAPLALALILVPGLAQAGDDKDDFPKFADEVKGWTAHEGFFRLYTKEKEERLLAAIPSDLLGEPFFLATSVSGGSDYAGWQWEDKLVRFERFDTQLLLVELNTRQRAQEGKPLAEVVRRTYSDRLVASLSIQSIGDGGEVLVDLGSLLTGQISTFFGYFFSINSSLARFAQVKPFPDNVEVSIQAPTYGDGTFLTLHYSISRLPDVKSYTPRVADERLGYFLTAIRDYTGGDPNQGRMVRFINRWQLEKADPELELSPPKEPIVFYVEKTVPIAYRRAVAEGILAWNQAFEQVGIQGAIDVRQQTETQFADIDPEDVRYNFFRWITSETPFAMGPSRVDPRTGRILDADIVFDDSMLRGYIRDYDLMIAEDPEKRLTRGMAALLARNPRAHPLARTRPAPPSPQLARLEGAARELLARQPQAGPALEALAGETAAETAARAPERLRAGTLCQLGQLKPHQVGLMRLALDGLRAEGKPTDKLFDDYLTQVVKETVMHEVGHTLGLRHNFKASSLVDLDAINSKERPEVLSASVMDYHPVNLSPFEDHPQGNFLIQTVGPYDMLAIEYGYSLVKEDSDELKAIPRKLAAQGLPYATDEDVGAPDPRIARWDLGDDPIKWGNYRVALAKKLWTNLEKRTIEDNESYSQLRRALNATLYEIQSSALSVASLVGGLHFERDRKGDPNGRPPISVVDAAQQRAALAWLGEKVFAADAFDVPPGLLSKVAAGRWLHWGSNDGDGSLEYSLMDRIANIQSWAIFYATADDVLARTWENEQRVLQEAKEGEAQPLTLPELFETLEGSIFSELDDPQAMGQQDASALSPAVSSLRQNLQDTYVRRLIQIALGSGISPPIARKLAWSRLKALESRFQRILTLPKLDPYTRAHLEVLEAESEQARTPEQVHVASGANCNLAPRRDPAPWAALALGLLLLGLMRARRA